MTEDQKLFAQIATQILVARISQGEGLPKDQYLAYRAVEHARVIMNNLPEDPQP